MISRKQSLIGEVYGSLTVESYVGLDGRGKNRMWLCRCACGGTSQRSTAVLTYGRGISRELRCKTCVDDSNKNRMNNWASEKRKSMRRMWDTTGSLYSRSALKQMRLDIREAVGDELGGWCETMKLPVEVMPAEAHGRVEVGDNGYYGASLVDIGTLFGLSRERVRQVQEKALAKLRRAPELIESFERSVRAPERLPVKLASETRTPPHTSPRTPPHTSPRTPPHTTPRPLPRTSPRPLPVAVLDAAIDRAYKEQARRQRQRERAIENVDAAIDRASIRV